jgi:hypothetical protein
MARARPGPPQPHPCAHARSCTSTRCGAHPSLINTTFLPTGHILERVSRKLDGSMRGARRWNSVTSTSSCAGAAFDSALLLWRARHRQAAARRAHRAQVRIHLAARAQASSVAPAWGRAASGDPCALRGSAVMTDPSAGLMPCRIYGQPLPSAHCTACVLSNHRTLPIARRRATSRRRRRTHAEAPLSLPTTRSF